MKPILTLIFLTFLSTVSTVQSCQGATTEVETQGTSYLLLWLVIVVSVGYAIWVAIKNSTNEN